MNGEMDNGFCIWNENYIDSGTYENGKLLKCDKLQEQETELDYDEE